MKTDVTPVQIVDRMAELLATPERWTQGVYSRDAYDFEVSYSASDAACFCWLGANYKANFELRPSTEVRFIVRKAMEEAIDGIGVTYFNDSPTTTHADILAANAKARAILAGAA